MSVAVDKGYKEIVKLLLARKDIDVNKESYDKSTSLFMAIEEGFIDIAKRIIAHKSAEKNIEKVNWPKVLKKAQRLLKYEEYKKQEKDILKIIWFIENKIEQVKEIKEKK